MTKNYKTKLIPFGMLNLALIRRNKEDLKKYGDSWYSLKYDYRNYQIVLSTL